MMIIFKLFLVTVTICFVVTFLLSDAYSQLYNSWQLYTDPENEFSMQYPSSWILRPADNRFDLLDVEILNSGDATNGLVQIQYNIMSEELSSLMKQYDVDQAELEQYLDIFFPAFLTGFSRSLDGFHQIENANYEKYNIDGHKAGSTVYSFEVSGRELAGWVTVTLIGNKLFAFMYGADQNTFDTNLPIAEQMLNSIKISDEQ
jgi:hypothetical protein